MSFAPSARPAPSRRVGSGRCNTAFRFASRKMGLVIQAEARETELAAAITWEHAPAFLSSGTNRTGSSGTPGCKTERRRLSEVIRLPRHCNGLGRFHRMQKRRVATRSTGHWPRGLRAQADGSWTHPELEQAADALGLGFHVRSSRENCWPLIRNLDLLRTTCDPTPRSPRPTIRHVFWPLSPSMVGLTVQQIVDLGDCMADSLYAMIARLDVHVDLLQHVLAEADRTYIYRDKELAAVYEEHEPDLAPVAADAPFIPRRGAWVSGMHDLGASSISARTP